MSTLLPHSAGDLALAPVLISLERNLDVLRTCDDVAFELALELNDMEYRYTSPEARALRVLKAVVRNVNLHGLDVGPTDDLSGVSVTHGEYRVSLALGSRLATYVVHGVAQSAGRAV